MRRKEGLFGIWKSREGGEVRRSCCSLEGFGGWVGVKTLVNAEVRM